MILKKNKVKLKDIKPINIENLKWSDKQLSMVDSISNGYDTKKGYIKVFKDDYINDGNHRYILLLDKFGGDYEIDIKRIPLKRNVYINISITLIGILFITFLPLSLILAYILNKRAKKKKRL